MPNTLLTIPFTCNRFDIERYAEHYRVPADTWIAVKGRDGQYSVMLNDKYFTPGFEREFNRDFSGVCEPHRTNYRKAFDRELHNYVLYLQSIK